MNGVRNLNSDKNQTIAALTVLILIWVGYRAALIAWGNFFGTDGAFSLDLALSILHTGVPRVPLWDGWVHASEYMFMHGVVNGIVQALVLAVTGGAYWFVSLKILSVLVAVGTLFLAFRWSVWSCRDLRAGLIVTALVAFDPIFWKYTGFTRNEMLMACFMTLALYLLHRQTLDPSWGKALAYGGVSGIAVLTFMPAACLAPIGLAAVLCCVPGKRQKTVSLVLMAAGGLTVIAPYFLWIALAPDRLAIFLIQMSRATEGVMPFTDMVIRMAMKALASFQGGYAISYGSWFILTASISGALAWKDRKNRFFFVTLTIGLLFMSLSHSVNPKRMLPFIPMATLALVKTGMDDPRRTLAALAIASTAIALFHVPLGYLGLYRFFPAYFHNQNITSICILAAAPVLVILVWKDRRSPLRTQTLHRTLGLLAALVFAQYLAGASLDVGRFVRKADRRNLFTEQGVEAARKALREILPSDGATILAQPQFARLIPEPDRVKTIHLVTSPLYYPYFPDYEALWNKLDPQYIVIDVTGRRMFRETAQAEAQLARDYFLYKTADVGRTFMVFKRLGGNDQ